MRAVSSDLLMMLVNVGSRVFLQPLRIVAGIGSSSQDFLHVFWPEIFHNHLLNIFGMDIHFSGKRSFSSTGK